MQSMIMTMFVVACGFSLDAQIAATLNHSPGGLEEIMIENNSTTSLVAFVVYTKELHPAEPSTPLLVYSDVIDLETKPLPPKEERVVAVRRPVLPGGHIFEEPIITAGIFADGTAAGDTALITRLISRRSNMLLAIETALDTLSDAVTHNVSGDRLIEKFRTMADSLNRWYLPAEQQAGRGIYLSLVGKLTDLPKQPVGSLLPPSFVAQETSGLRQRRVNLLETKPSLADAALVR